MNNKRRFLVVAVALMFLFVVQRVRAQNNSDADILQKAWELTEQIGSYDFTTQLTETTFPAPRITSVGPSAKYQTLYLEGTTDRQEGTLELSLWNDPSSVQNPEQALELRVEGTRAYGRVGDGTWEEIDDFTGTFAPSGDAAAFLRATDNVRGLGTDSRSVPQVDGTLRQITFERYAFTLNGERFAENMRQMLQDQLIENGELPPGVTLSTGTFFQNAVGEGEAWIDDKGLPLRMTIDIEFPQQRNGERIFLDLQTDFTSFNDPLRVSTATFSSNPLAWVNSQVIEFSTLANVAKQFALVISVLAFFALVYKATYLWPKKSYNVVAATIVTQMALAPLATLWDAHRVTQFRNRYPTTEQVESDSVDALVNTPQPLWDPQQSPLEAGRIAYESQQFANGIQPQRDDRGGRPSTPSTTSITTSSGIDNDQDGLDANDEVAWGLQANDPD